MASSLSWKEKFIKLSFIHCFKYTLLLKGVRERSEKSNLTVSFQLKVGTPYSDSNENGQRSKRSLVYSTFCTLSMSCCLAHFLLLLQHPAASFRGCHSGSIVSSSSHPIPKHLLLYYIHDPPLTSSSFPSACQLHLQQPLSNISTILPLHIYKPSQLCFPNFISNCSKCTHF